MINIGDVIRIDGYDYEEMVRRKKEYRVVEICRNFVRAIHIKGGYSACFDYHELAVNGYVPYRKDVLER